MILSTFEEISRGLFDILNGGYIILKEMDLSAIIFLLLFNHSKINRNQLHLNVKVCEYNNAYFDIAFGLVKSEKCIIPSEVVEIKILPNAFSSQQCRRRYESIFSDDMPKVSKLKSSVEKVLLIFDEKEYLKGTYSKKNRLAYLIEKRQTIDPTIKIIVIKKTKNDWKYLNY